MPFFHGNVYCIMWVFSLESSWKRSKEMKLVSRDLDHSRILLPPSKNTPLKYQNDEFQTQAQPVWLFACLTESKQIQNTFEPARVGFLWLFLSLGDHGTINSCRKTSAASVFINFFIPTSNQKQYPTQTFLFCKIMKNKQHHTKPYKSTIL